MTQNRRTFSRHRRFHERSESKKGETVFTTQWPPAATFRFSNRQSFSICWVFCPAGGGHTHERPITGCHRVVRQEVTHIADGLTEVINAHE